MQSRPDRCSLRHARLTGRAQSRSREPSSQSSRHLVRSSQDDRTGGARRRFERAAVASDPSSATGAPSGTAGGTYAFRRFLTPGRCLAIGEDRASWDDSCRHRQGPRGTTPLATEQRSETGLTTNLTRDPRHGTRAARVVSKPARSSAQLACGQRGESGPGRCRSPLARPSVLMRLVLASRYEASHVGARDRSVGDADTAMCSLRYCRLMPVYACLGMHLVATEPLPVGSGEAREAAATNASCKGQDRVDLLVGVRRGVGLLRSFEPCSRIHHPHLPVDGPPARAPAAS